MKVRAYHGTNGRFSRFEQSKARIANDFYGGGVAYFTDTMDIAKSYASFMFRKGGGEKYVYECDLDFDKLFDVEAKFTGEALVKLVGTQIEAFARGARLMTLGVDKYALLSQLANGKIELTGDQVFRGMSNGMQNTASARDRLKALGYDGLRHIGGVNMGGQRHIVYLAYDANKIKIVNRYIISNAPVTALEKTEKYTFIN